MTLTATIRAKVKRKLRRGGINIRCSVEQEKLECCGGEEEEEATTRGRGRGEESRRVGGRYRKRGKKREVLKGF